MASCVDVSLLTHVTVVPRVMLSGFGENAVVVSVRAPGTIETEAEVEVADGAVLLLLLQAARLSTQVNVTMKRTNMIPVPPARHTGQSGYRHR
jgi:hypothetical protein